MPASERARRERTRRTHTTQVPEGPARVAAQVEASSLARELVKCLDGGAATGVVRVKPDDRKDFSFCIKVPGRDWVLDPGSLAQWQEWEAKLRPMVGGD